MNKRQMNKRQAAFHELARDCDWPRELVEIHRSAQHAHIGYRLLDDLEVLARREGLVSDWSKTLLLRERVQLWQDAASAQWRVLTIIDQIGAAALEEWRAAAAAAADDQ